MRTGNPALRADTFTAEAVRARTGGSLQEAMTVQGTVNKTLMLLFLVIAPASYVWTKFFAGELDPAMLSGLMMGGGILGFIVAIVTVFKKTAAPYTAPIYAVCEGVLLGALSTSFEMRYPGIVIQAVALTLGVMLAMLFVYKSGFVRVTDNFRIGMMAATGGVAIVYLISFVLGFFGTTIPYIHSSSPIGIGFSCIVVAIAAFNLVLDFDFIERGEEARAPKYMEWYAAFGLLVTLVWLYMEILRLLSKSRSRN